MYSSCFSAFRRVVNTTVLLQTAEDAPELPAGERIMQASDQAFGAENLGMDNAG